MSLLVEGIRAWERNDQVKAAHVLIPQIEHALRKIADGLAVPVTKAHPRVSGTSVAIGMGEILYNDRVTEALGPDATLHFQALYADPRGLNLRNEIAHGLMDADQFYWHLGNLIVHSLVILGCGRSSAGSAIRSIVRPGAGAPKKDNAWAPCQRRRFVRFSEAAMASSHRIEDRASVPDRHHEKRRT